MALLPLPRDWQMRRAQQLIDISLAAHARGTIEPSEQRTLDDIVARNYGLSAADINAFQEFDGWLTR
jgi:hypothetical protein